jgi:hypothetical protein
VGGYAPPSAKRRATWSDQFVKGSALLVGLLASASAYSIFVGNGAATFWFAHAAAMFSLLVLSRHARMLRETKQLSMALTSAERALTVNAAQLTAAANINKGFKKNFNRLLCDERANLQRENRMLLQRIAEKKAEADQRVRKADDQRRDLKRLTERLVMNELEYLTIGDLELTFDESSSRLRSLIEFCREHGGHISNLREEDCLDALAKRFEQKLRRQRDQQRRRSYSVDAERKDGSQTSGRP